MSPSARKRAFLDPPEIEITPNLATIESPSSIMKSIAAFCSRHPWLYVVMAFALLIGAWSALINVAIKHTPQQVEIRSHSGR